MFKCEFKGSIPLEGAITYDSILYVSIHLVLWRPADGLIMS